jgi:hypothetical protein
VRVGGIAGGLGFCPVACFGVSGAGPWVLLL